MPKYNPNIDSLNVDIVQNPVEQLGHNIMFDDAIPEDKHFMHDLIKTKYVNPNILNNIKTYQVIQNSETFDFIRW